MKTSVYRISDICSIKSGKRLPAGTDFSCEPTPYRYIRSRDIKGGKISLEDVAYIDEETKEKIKKYIINSGDIAITIVANIGDIGYATQECDGINLTENAVRLTCFDEKHVYSKYLAYYLRQDSMKSYMEGLSVGAAQAKLGIYKIEKIKLQLPLVDIQKSISSIIEKYESLIEANNKRIKVLEQMAENLYKEWFVRFRFPGHETAEFENGLPKGWRTEKLKTIADFQYGKMPSQEHVVDNGYPIYTGYRTSGYYDSFLYEKPMLLVIARGVGGTGDVKISPPKVFITNLSIVILLKNPELLMYYLYQLFQLHNLRYLDSGAAQSQITIEDLQRVRIILPDNSTLMKYSNAYLPISNEIHLLEEKNTNLIKQRDLLLPRMMSGKQEV